MTFKELQPVRSLVELNDSLKIGSRGTIVFVYGANGPYEVEFFSTEGEAIGLITVKSTEIEPRE